MVVPRDGHWVLLMVDNWDVHLADLKVEQKVARRDVKKAVLKARHSAVQMVVQRAARMDHKWVVQLADCLVGY